MKIRPVQEHEQKPVDMEGAVGVKMRMLIGPAEKATNFHMRHFTVHPGGHTPRHQHDYEHEIIVLAGSGTAHSAAGERAFQAGDVIWVPADEAHQFCNTGAQPLELICLIPAPKDCAQ